MAKFIAFKKIDNFIDDSTGEIASKGETKVLKYRKVFLVESAGTLYGLNAVFYSINLL